MQRGRRRRSASTRAAAIERAARILGAAGPDTPEAQLAASLRLEARALTENLADATDPYGVVVTLSSISVDVVAGTGTAVASYITDTGRGSRRVDLRPCFEAEGVATGLDDDLWYATHEVDTWLVEAIDASLEAQVALAAAVAAASVGIPPASMRRTATRSPSLASTAVPLN